MSSILFTPSGGKSSRKGEVPIGLDGKHVPHLGQLQVLCQIAARVVVGEDHKVVCPIVLRPVRVLRLHVLQRLPHQLRRVLQRIWRLDSTALHS